MAQALRPFHLAFAVDDLDAARGFYRDTLGCAEGRSSDTWIDFNLGGHQVVAHLAPEECGRAVTKPVDGKGVPARHFGLVLPWTDWEALAERCRAAGCAFLIEPYVRFKGDVGEQGTFFIEDPAGNALEFKSFKDDDRLFATD